MNDDDLLEQVAILEGLVAALGTSLANVSRLADFCLARLSPEERRDAFREAREEQP